MNRKIEDFIEGENCYATLYFSLCGKTLQWNSFEHVKNEIIVDDYFQIEPNVCCFRNGQWPKTRQIIASKNNCLESNNVFIYASKIHNPQDNGVSFNVVTKNSMFELTEYIFDLKEMKKMEVTHQEYIASTVILRQVFIHKENSNIILQVSSLRLGEVYHVFGKIIVLDGCKEDLINAFKDLSNNGVFIPCNKPVIQKLLHTDEGCEIVEHIKDQYRVHSLNSRSICCEPLLLVDSDRNLLEHFEMLCSQEQY